MQHTQHHYVYTHGAAFDADESARMCVHAAWNANRSRQSSLQAAPNSIAAALARTTDAISPSPVCNVRFLVALAADSINY